MLERQTVRDVIGEQDLANSGRVAKAQSARTGKITAAHVLIKGTITEFQINSEKSGSEFSIGDFALNNT